MDEVEAKSVGATSFTEIAENIELRRDRVYYASGRPFEGALSKKQLFLLRTSGKLIAQTPSRTSKDFVKMPSVL